MDEKFSRTELLFGEKAMEKLKKSRVAVFGIGGVGGHLAEALVRSGIGAIDLIDNDKFSLSNINRQIFADMDTIGEYKVEAAKRRLERINPDVTVRVHKTFFLPENSADFDFSCYDYVADAIDTISGKLELAVRAKEAGVPIISSMGAGNKLSPEAFEVSDVYKTSVCPLARVMRRELKKRGIEKLKVVYSKEPSLTPEIELMPTEDASGKKSIPGSVAFVPSVAGLIMAGEVIKDLIKDI